MTPDTDQSKYILRVNRYNSSDPDSQFRIRTNQQTTNTSYDVIINPTNMSVQQPIISTAAIPASSDSSTRVPTTAWVQSAITTSASNITPNSVTITPNNYNTSGLKSAYNVGSINSTTNAVSVSYGTGTYYVPNGVPRIRIISNNTSTPILLAPVEFRLTMFFYNSSSGAYGQTCCNLLLFPASIKSDWGTSTNIIYNINNKINGNGSFIYSDATYAPFGRQYWTYNQSFSGETSNAFLYGVNTSTGSNFQYDIFINTLLPNSGFSYSTTIECIQSIGFTGGTNCGIQISAYS
jgi:hypothetical protein